MGFKPMLQIFPENIYTKRLISCLLLSFLGLCSSAQSFRKMASLPAEIHESSGLLCLGNGRFLTHNDGGNANKIYFIDSLGQLLHSTVITNMQNIDWEDIALSDDEMVYIGDIGNNGHNRRDLRIGMVSLKDLLSEDSVSANFIHFVFSDQREFPPPASEQRFDCEAMAFFADSLYLITKNWTSPFTGLAYLYSMAADTGNLVAVKRDSFNFGTFKEIAWITGMDIQHREMVLSGSAYVWVFSVNDYPRFTTLKSKLEAFPISQKEAICADADAYYLTDESTGGFGNLYSMSVKTSGIIPAITRPLIKIGKDLIVVEGLIEFRSITIFSAEGKTIYSGLISHGGDIGAVHIPVMNFPPGVYYFSFEDLRGKRIIQTVCLP